MRHVQPVQPEPANNEVAPYGVRFGFESEFLLVENYSFKIVREIVSGHAIRRIFWEKA